MKPASLKLKIFFYALGLIFCIAPPTVAILSFFPFWLGVGEAKVASGFVLLLCVIAHVPLLKAIKRLLRSEASYLMWLIIFLLFLMLEAIAFEMTVISFVDMEGNRVANMIHYGAHGTASGRNHEITRDWSGVMTDALEKHSDAITAFFNGPEGDVGPRLSNGRTVGNLNYMRELGEIAAKDATRIFDKISNYNGVDMSASTQKLLIPLKKRMPLGEAKALLAQYKDRTENCGAMMKSHFEEVIESYQKEFIDKPAVEVEQTLITLGDIVFASFPYELFSEIGMRINKLVKTKSVLSLSNSNGSEGYYITRDVACRGGYEVNMFLYAHIQQFHDDADFYIMKESVKHIKNLINED